MEISFHGPSENISGVDGLKVTVRDTSVVKREEIPKIVQYMIAYGCITSDDIFKVIM